jgi:AcrR family transcriptional regulator
MADPKPANEKREEQRARVLQVASRLFAAHGFDDVTMADIAAEAGVARATVFNYFGSKHSLVEALTESVIDFYTGMLEHALADEVTPTPALVRRLFVDMGEGIEADRRFFRGVFREIARVQLGLDEGSVAQRAQQVAHERVERLVVRGQRRGDLRDEIDANDLTVAMTSIINGTITNWLYTDTSVPLTDRMRAAAEVFLSPVEARVEAAGRRTRRREGARS